MCVCVCVYVCVCVCVGGSDTKLDPLIWVLEGFQVEDVTDPVTFISLLLSVLSFSEPQIDQISHHKTTFYLPSFFVMG